MSGHAVLPRPHLPEQKPEGARDAGARSSISTLDDPPEDPYERFPERGVRSRGEAAGRGAGDRMAERGRQSVACSTRTRGPVRPRGWRCSASTWSMRVPDADAGDATSPSSTRHCGRAGRPRTCCRSPVSRRRASATGWEVHLDATRLMRTPAPSIAFQPPAVGGQPPGDRPHRRTSVLVHASAAAFAGRRSSMPGPMGAGKSTLAAALVRAGLGYLTDEVVAIDPGSGLVRPYPKYLSLGPRSRTAAASRRRGSARSSATGSSCPPEALRPGAVAGTGMAARRRRAPRTSAGATTELTPLRPADRALDAGAARVPSRCATGRAPSPCSPPRSSSRPATGS